MQNDAVSAEKTDTNHEVLKMAVFPPPPAVGSQRGCYCRCAYSDYTQQLPTLFLHRTGQPHTCQDRHISGKEKKIKSFTTGEKHNQIPNRMLKACFDKLFPASVSYLLWRWRRFLCKCQFHCLRSRFWLFV